MDELEKKILRTQAIHDQAMKVLRNLLPDILQTANDAADINIDLNKHRNIIGVVTNFVGGYVLMNQRGNVDLTDSDSMKTILESYDRLPLDSRRRLVENILSNLDENKLHLIIDFINKI